MKRNVIIEVKQPAALGAVATATAGFGSEIAPTLATAVPELKAILPSVDLDPTYPGVLLPSSSAFTYRADAVGAASTWEVGLAESYVIRGQVEEDDLDRVTDEAVETGAVAVFADPTIAGFPVCPGGPPKGTDKDVERLLCVERLRQAGMDGSGVLVAIVDTGINMAYLNSRGKHPRFDAVRSWAPAGGGTPGKQPVGHGTMCAYDVCIAAPHCILLDVSVLLSQAPGATVMGGLLSDAVRAYSHLLRMLQQPRQPGEALSLVVNNSWGMYNPGWDFPVGHPGNYSDNSDHTFNRLVRTLVRAGADILFAAGNCGADCPARDCENVVDRAIYGANGHPQVLCVGGVDVTGARVGYSSIGPARLSPDKPDICGFTHFAGSGVYAADSGTSAATPVVAGVVAAYRTRVPSGSGATPADVGDLLRRTAVKVEGSGFDHQTGWGIVNGCGISSTPVPGSQEVADAVDQLAMKMEATA